MVAIASVRVGPHEASQRRVPNSIRAPISVCSATIIPTLRGLPQYSADPNQTRRSTSRPRDGSRDRQRMQKDQHGLATPATSGASTTSPSTPPASASSTTASFRVPLRRFDGGQPRTRRLLTLDRKVYGATRVRRGARRADPRTIRCRSRDQLRARAWCGSSRALRPPA